MRYCSALSEAMTTQIPRRSARLRSLSSSLIFHRGSASSMMVQPQFNAAKMTISALYRSALSQRKSMFLLEPNLVTSPLLGSWRPLLLGEWLLTVMTTARLLLGNMVHGTKLLDDHFTLANAHAEFTSHLGLETTQRDQRHLRTRDVEAFPTLDEIQDLRHVPC